MSDQNQFSAIPLERIDIDTDVQMSEPEHD